MIMINIIVGFFAVWRTDVVSGFSNNLFPPLSAEPVLSICSKKVRSRLSFRVVVLNTLSKSPLSFRVASKKSKNGSRETGVVPRSYPSNNQT